MSAPKGRSRNVKGFWKLFVIQLGFIVALAITIIGFWADIKAVWEDFLRPVPLIWVIVAFFVGQLVLTVFYTYRTMKEESEQLTLSQTPPNTITKEPKRTPPNTTAKEPNQTTSNSPIKEPNQTPSNSTTKELDQTSSNNTTKDMETDSPALEKDPWVKQYTRDTYKGIPWVWNWTKSENWTKKKAHKYDIVDLLPLCPLCLMEMHPFSRYSSLAWDMIEVLYCYRCGIKRVEEVWEEDLKREIKRRVRTGKWKDAEARVAKAREYARKDKEERKFRKWKPY